MKPSRDYRKPLNGQRESRVQKADPSGRDKRLDGRALAQVLSGWLVPPKVRT